MKQLLLRAYPDTLARLRDMGEWAALGFYEGFELPWPRSYGLAFRRLYENMEIHFRDGALLLPSEPLPRARTMESHQVGAAESLICDFKHDCGLRVNDRIVEEGRTRFPQHGPFLDALVADLRPRLQRFGGYTHSNPDIRRVVNEGFDAMEAELDAEIAAVAALGDKADPGETNLFAALKDYTIGVRAFHSRVTTELRKAADAASGTRHGELTLIADSFANGFLKPSTTFMQGILAVHFAWMLDGCDSIGRVDQTLGHLYETDIRNKTITRDFAQRLLDEFFQNFERFNGWNLQIGGYRPDGGEGYNTLTREIILACGRCKFGRPNVAFRVTRKTPDKALIETLKTLREGSGRPAIYNDDLYVKTLKGMDLGLTDEDSREIGFGGCTETMISGLSNVGSLEGKINLAKMVELAMHDGCDPMTGKQEGPHAGRFQDFADFPEFLAAVKRQIQYATDCFAAHNRSALANRFTKGDPKLYRTFFTRDCVKRRKSFEAGGARYNWAVVSYHGIANLIDSLAAVRKCVFEDKSVTRDELLAALQADFQGHETTRDKLKAAPKFGNDDPCVDDIARDVIGYAWNELYSHETPRGGRYLASCILFTTYAEAGKWVGALPDGRLVGTALTDSVGPVQGRDTHGPTAMLKSVAKLPLWLAVGTPVLNIRFQKQFLATEKGLKACVDLIRTFFDLGGMQIQVSVLDKAEMLAAQKEPEKHADLIVRIGGYSEYFTKLSRALQDSVIERTEHGGV
jgi:formate C-acetyltransferase